MCHGVRAYNGLSHTQVLAAVAVEGRSLKFVKGSYRGLQVEHHSGLLHSIEFTRLHCLSPAMCLYRLPAL